MVLSKGQNAYTGTADQNIKLLEVLKKSQKIEIRLAEMREAGETDGKPLSAEIAAETAWRSCRIHALALQTIARDFSPGCQVEVEKRAVALAKGLARCAATVFKEKDPAKASAKCVVDGLGMMFEHAARTGDLMTCELAHNIVDKTKKELEDMTNVLVFFDSEGKCMAVLAWDKWRPVWRIDEHTLTVYPPSDGQ